MANDHFIPRAYLRGFTHEYLTGQKGGKLVVHNPSSGNSGSLSINEHVACEPEFYNGHPLDKKWSETIERTWGNVRDRLKAGENTPELLDQLFWFVSAQFIRTHSFMSRVGRQIALEERKKSQVTLDGREVSGIIMNVADTTSVMDRVQASWPTARDALEMDYVWTVYHNHSERLFLTSDDPCQLDDRTQKVVMPLALDLAITGRLVRDSEAPYLRHSDASAEVVRKTNQGVVRECRRLVYSHEQTDELRRFVTTHCAPLPSDPLRIGRGFVNNPEPFTDKDAQRIIDRINELRRREREQAQSGDAAATQPPLQR
jgi:hypothetical protein